MLPSKPVRYAGETQKVIGNLEISGYKGQVGIELEDCHKILIHDCIVSGCSTNIRLLNCSEIIIRACTLSDPLGPPDPDGQDVQLDKCTNCMIVSNRCIGGENAEDLINIYQSTRCVVKNNNISGHGKSDSGSGICIDDGCVNIVLRGNTLSRMGKRGIVVAGGTRHRLQANTVADTTDAGIAVQGCYGVVSRVILQKNIVIPRDGPDIYVEEETTRRVTIL